MGEKNDNGKSLGEEVSFKTRTEDNGNNIIGISNDVYSGVCSHSADRQAATDEELPIKQQAQQADDAVDELQPTTT